MKFNRATEAEKDKDWLKHIKKKLDSMHTLAKYRVRFADTICSINGYYTPAKYRRNVRKQRKQLVGYYILHQWGEYADTITWD